MKKLLLLCLVLLGGVMQASATILHICVEYNNPGDIYVYRFGSPTHADDNWNTMGDEQKATFDAYKYGRRWYTYDIDDYAKAIIRFDNWSKQTTDIVGISGDDYYIYVANNNNSQEKGYYWAGQLSNPYWGGLAIRNSLDNDYSIYTSNMIASDDKNTFTRTFTKEFIDEHKGGNNSIWFRLKHTENQFYDEDGNYKNTWLQIYPATNNTLLNIASNTTSYNQGSDSEGSTTWQVNLPSYNYEKIVITAEYSYSNVSNKYIWTISADAYITKTITAANEYATLGCSVPLEIVEANGVTAHPLTANGSTGKITKGDAITEIPANKGALLENATGSDKTIRAKVLASASAGPSNQLKAFTGSGKLTQPTPEENKTYYILTKKNDNVGFYKVNTTSGNSMGANTAYLEVDGIITLARDFFVLEGETTGIANLNVNDNANFNADAPMYNLAGQRVGKNYKGVVIVNGKKMILK